jgi:ribosomal protein L37AE/L43A
MSDLLLLAKYPCPNCGTEAPVSTQTRTCRCGKCNADFTPGG